MTSARIAVVWLPLCCVLAAQGCCGVFAPLELRAADGASTLEVPFGWEETSGLYELSSLETHEVAKKVRVIVVTEDKRDFELDLDGYLTMVVERMRVNMDPGTCRVSEAKYLSIGGEKAAQVEVDASMGGQGFTYLVTAVDGDKQWHHLLGWGTDSRYLTHRKAIRRVVESFKESGEPANLDYLGIRAVSEAGPGDALTSEDGVARITPPAGWVLYEAVEDDVTLKIHYPDVNLFFMVLSFAREEAEEGRTVVEHSEYTRIRLGDKGQQYEETGPEQLEIDGHPAVQYRIDTVEDEWRRTYLHTTVATDSHFHQLIGWSSYGRYERYSDHIEAVTLSFEQGEWSDPAPK